MIRRLVLVLAALFLVLSACGGGVDDNGDDNGGAAVTADTKPNNDNGAATTAPADDNGDNADNGDIPPGQDPRNILGEEGDEEDDLANECFDGDMAACDELFSVTDVGSDLEAYAETCGGRIDQQDGAPDCEARFPGDPQDPGNLSDDPELADSSDADIARFEDLADECFDGDLGSCDDLFSETPVGSDFEAYAQTCGGRISEQDGAPSCEDRLGDSSGSVD